MSKTNNFDLSICWTHVFLSALFLLLGYKSILLQFRNIFFRNFDVLIMSGEDDRPKLPKRSMPINNQCCRFSKAFSPKVEWISSIDVLVYSFRCLESRHILFFKIGDLHWKTGSQQLPENAIIDKFLLVYRQFFSGRLSVGFGGTRLLSTVDCGKWFFDNV